MHIKQLLWASLAATAFAWGPAAHAIPVMNTYPVDSTAPLTGPFKAVIAPNGVITATIDVTHNFTNDFVDDFTFTVPVKGTGSGSLTTSTSRLGVSPDLDFISVTLNGVNIPITRTPNDANDFFEIAFVINFPIDGLALNHLVVTGHATKPSSYAGTLTFTPAAVPEASTWAMMMIGFGGIGGSMRYRRQKAVAANNLRTIANA